MYSLIYKFIKTEMLKEILEKPLRAVGVPAGFACTILMYNAATAYIEISKLERMNAIAKESSRIRMEEHKKKMPWPICLLY